MLTANIWSIHSESYCSEVTFYVKVTRYDFSSPVRLIQVTLHHVRSVDYSFTECCALMFTLLHGAFQLVAGRARRGSDRPSQSETIPPDLWLLISVAAGLWSPDGSFIFAPISLWSTTTVFRLKWTIFTTNDHLSWAVNPTFMTRPGKEGLEFALTATLRLSGCAMIL